MTRPMWFKCFIIVLKGKQLSQWRLRPIVGSIRVEGANFPCINGRRRDPVKDIASNSLGRIWVINRKVFFLINTSLLNHDVWSGNDNFEVTKRGRNVLAVLLQKPSYGPTFLEEYSDWHPTSGGTKAPKTLRSFWPWPEKKSFWVLPYFSVKSVN